MARRVALLLSALALVLALAGNASATARVPRGFVGTVVGPPIYTSDTPAVDLSSAMDTMASSGVESLRFVANWSYAQPYASWAEVPASQKSDFVDAGGVPTRFDRLDQLVAAAAKHRLNLLPTVLYAPSWDAAPVSTTSYPQPSSVIPYANFLTALVDRYGPNGSFWQNHSPRVPIRMWQIWNEPNLSVFWPEQPFASSYVAMLAAAHAAIKSADPGARVVLAGMPNFSWRSLSSIYAVPGAAGLFDVVAVHPFTRDPAGVITIIRKIRRVMNANGDRRKPIIADEVSWPSSLGRTPHTEGYDFATTERGQARNIAALLPMLARDQRQLGLLGFNYYDWAGAEERGGRVFDFAGLFRFTASGMAAKPAFHAFRRAALAMERCRRKGDVATVCRKHV
jgi:hypothetical protein